MEIGASVECHSGFTYAERPAAFQWRGARLEVEGVIAEWRTPEGRHFRVRTTDGQVFELMYVETLVEWRIRPS